MAPTAMPPRCPRATGPREAQLQRRRAARDAAHRASGGALAGAWSWGEALAAGPTAIDDFAREQGLDARATRALRAHPPDVQAAVVMAGDLRSSTNPSASLLGRLRDAMAERRAARTARASRAPSPAALADEAGVGRPAAAPDDSGGEEGEEETRSAPGSGETRGNRRVTGMPSPRRQPAAVRRRRPTGATTSDTGPPGQRSAGPREPPRARGPGGGTRRGGGWRRARPDDTAGGRARGRSGHRR